MRTDRMRTSQNVEDRRGQGGGGFGGGFGGGRGGPKIAVGGIGGIILIVLFIALGGNPLALLGPGGSVGGGGGPIVVTGPGGPGGPAATNPAHDDEKVIVEKTLGDTEDVWGAIFQARFNQPYPMPRLVIFSDSVSSACGLADSAVGPFYCPADSMVYIDLSFLDEMSHRFDAPGDFAQAYVVAHEVGHHVQNLLGISDQVHAARQRVSESEYNDLSVRLELQADYFAGVWAHHAQKQRQILDPNDLEEALGAAAAVGDDRLQKRARGYVVPDSFTHGTSAQRMKWFKLGFESGDPLAHDPFKVERP